MTTLLFPVETVPLPLRFPFAVALGLAACPVAAGEAMLEVHVQDADVADWIVIRNAGGCDAVSGRLRIDFGPSRGRVVIDTEYGGGGTLHPAEVQVLNGPAEPLPVEDGARVLEVDLFALATGDQAVLTLDIDNERDGPEAAQIVATPADIEGARAVFSAGGGMPPVETVFGGAGSAYLEVPCVPPGLVMAGAGPAAG